MNAQGVKSRGFFVGEFCDDADQCSDGPPHTICNAMSQRCDCDPAYPIVVDGTICVQRELSFFFFVVAFLTFCLSRSLASRLARSRSVASPSFFFICINVSHSRGFAGPLACELHL
jgi:hypothetical protein